MSLNPLPAGLMVIHGNHPEALRDLLVAWIKRYPLSPLEKKTILVHSNGVAQWLKLALAANSNGAQGGGCGIAAALDFSLPSRFLWHVYRAVLGFENVPEASPFDKPFLVWRLMRLLPEVIGEPEYAPLKRFLAEDDDLRKRFQLAERLADLFDQYQVYRADWLAAWTEGQDVLIQANGDCRALPDDQHWQASLWRRLQTDIGAGNSLATAGRASVHEAFMKRAAERPEGECPPRLPRRVVVFGISALPRQSLEVLAALARWTQVLMCVNNPCEHYWADIVADKELLRAEHARQRRRAGSPATLCEETLHLHAHPLLAAWGRQGRDFIGLLDEHDSESARAGYLEHFHAIQQRIDLFASHGNTCLLNQLQDDIRDLRPLSETRGTWDVVDPASDESIRFHVAHSPQREVEILHDQLLAAFAADPALHPRDVVIMVPDIEAYSPHIQAVFGLPDVNDPRYIPYSIADRSRRQHDPLLNALDRLLDLPRSRIAVSDVLALLDVPAVRGRFGITEDDLPLLHRWVRGANIRWGLNAEHRGHLGLAGAPEENTWRFGLRRMLLGYSVGRAADGWQDIDPYDEVGGLEAALLGPIVQFLDRLEAAWETLSQQASADQWCDRLRHLLAEFFDAGESDDAFTLQQLELALQRWQEACAEAGFVDSVPLSVVKTHWLAQVDEGGLSQRFFGGAVTFATLMPMRAIPFRHVCLLGMNDGDYPRTRAPMDFDLMGKDYRPGDRSRREDDRYLFLEAVLSARERLYISWVGRSINDNTPRPPSVLVGQLRDHLRAGWRLAGSDGDADKVGAALLEALTIEHRLQPFSPDYFPAAQEGRSLFTYAGEWRPAAASAVAPSGDQALPPLARTEPLTVRELADFLKDPVKAFFTRRLGVRLEADDPAADDHEPFELDALQSWALQDELIKAQADALRRGQSQLVTLEEQLERMRRRGQLAANEFGERMADALAAPMDDLFERYAEALAKWPTEVPGSEEIRFASASGLELADWLQDLRLNAGGQRGRVVLETRSVIKKGKYRGPKLIRHWVNHLAAHSGGTPITTLVISKAGNVTFEPLETDVACALLEAVIAAWQEGQCRPLPLPIETAFAWLAAAPAPQNAGKGGELPADLAEKFETSLATARRAYEGDGYRPGEVGQNVYLRRAYPDFDAVVRDGNFMKLAEALLRPLQRAMPVANGSAKTKNSSTTDAAGAST